MAAPGHSRGPAGVGAQGPPLTSPALLPGPAIPAVVPAWAGHTSLGSAALSQPCHLSHRWPGCPSEQSSRVPCCSCPSGSPDSGSPLPTPCPGARFVKVLYPPFDLSLVSQARFTLELPPVKNGLCFLSGSSSGAPMSPRSRAILDIKPNQLLRTLYSAWKRWLGEGGVAVF